MKTHLDCLSIETQALLLVRQEVLHILALVALELDYLAHLDVRDDGAIAGKLLLDHFENLLLVEFLGQSLDCGQGFAAIALCDVLACETRQVEGCRTVRMCWRVWGRMGWATYVGYECECSPADSA